MGDGSRPICNASYYRHITTVIVNISTPNNLEHVRIFILTELRPRITEKPEHHMLGTDRCVGVSSHLSSIRKVPVYLKETSIFPITRTSIFPLQEKSMFTLQESPCLHYKKVHLSSTGKVHVYITRKSIFPLTRKSIRLLEGFYIRMFYVLETTET